MRGNFIPREYDIFTGLDVSKKSISVTFTNHQGFIRSLNMPHKAEHLLNYVRKHFPDQKIAFVYEAGPKRDLNFSAAQMPNFTAHSKADVKPSDMFIDVLEKYVVPGREQDVLTTAKESMDIHRAYFGGMAQAMERAA